MAIATAPASEFREPVSAEVSRWYALWHVLKRKPLGLASAGLIALMVFTAIFALPGMGRLTVEAILFRDYPVVQTNVMLVAFALVTLNLLVDLTYAWLDPRIRYQ